MLQSTRSQRWGRKESDMTELLNNNIMEIIVPLSNAFKDLTFVTQGFSSVQSLSRVRLFVTP